MHKLANVRKKKLDDKKKLGADIQMPEVFVSNYMKQQRNFVKYRRQRNATAPEKVTDKQELVLPKNQRVSLNSLVMAVRVKKSSNTTPQAQKILNELGLKQINNCALFIGSNENL